MTSVSLTQDMPLAAIREALADIGHVCEFRGARIEIRPRPEIVPLPAKRKLPDEKLHRSPRTIAEAGHSLNLFHHHHYYGRRK